MKRISKEELEAAIDRMKPAGEGIMRWLLEFSQKDLSKISEGDWINLKMEFVVFQMIGVGKDLIDENLPGVLKPSREEFLRSPEMIETWQKITKKYLIDILQKKILSLKIPRLTFYLIPSYGDPWRTMRMVEDMNSLDVCTYALSKLLAKFAHLIRCCPECNKYFLADRKNQSFCSVKHQGYAAVRKYRKSKGLITGRKRGRPRKNDKLNKKRGS